MKGIIAFLLLLLLISPMAKSQGPAGSGETEPIDNRLSFDDLVTLSSTPNPDGDLRMRLEQVLASPMVRNNAVDAGVPHRPTVDGLGPVLRVGLWNIERGLNFELIQTALTNTAEFELLAQNSRKMSASQREAVESQLEVLRNADILVLNEVDVGMKRTGYRDVAGELAKALHMNYAYGVEFVEVDPVFELGAEKVHLTDAQQDERLQQELQVNQHLYRGLHGTAILSRYPIQSARILRLPACYDWYGQEVKEIAHIEKGKRWAAGRLFKERIGREVRRGGRMALIVSVAIPDSRTGAATIAATHLENRCKPACRRRQMEALLDDLKEDRNPVVMAGDLNTTSGNNTPTSIRNEIISRVTDYQFWISQTVSYFHPLGIYQHALFPVRYFHGYHDPTAFHLPIVWDNREQPLFRRVKKFRFDDGGVFDFRGDPDRTQGRRGRTLSDSNERGGKGFIPTYSFARNYGGVVGLYKLDWIFVKPFRLDRKGQAAMELFAPYFPRTMRELNESVEERIADHAPMTVDLPLGMPSPLVPR